MTLEHRPGIILLRRAADFLEPFSNISKECQNETR